MAKWKLKRGRLRSPVFFITKICNSSIYWKLQFYFFSYIISIDLFRATLNERTANNSIDMGKKAKNTHICEIGRMCFVNVFVQNVIKYLPTYQLNRVLHKNKWRVCSCFTYFRNGRFGRWSDVGGGGGGDNSRWYNYRKGRTNYCVCRRQESALRTHTLARIINNTIKKERNNNNISIWCSRRFEVETVLFGMLWRWTNTISHFCLLLATHRNR